MKRMCSALIVALLLSLSISLAAQQAPPKNAAPPPATAAAARAFLAEVDRELLKLINAANRAGWTQSTYITVDTETMAAEANEALVNATTRYAKEAARFDQVQVSPADGATITGWRNITFTWGQVGSLPNYGIQIQALSSGNTWFDAIQQLC